MAYYVKEIGTKDTVNTLLYDIDKRLGDNNAGLISAQDVRETMFNAVQSIPYIVASGDWESPEKQFISNVYLRTTVDTVNSTIEGGVLIVESGIQFNNEISGGALQVHAYPGPTGIQHDQLANLHLDNHPQYLLRSAGSRGGDSNRMKTNLGMEDNWINSEGSAFPTGHGIRFEHSSATEEVLHIGNETSITFDSDSTTFHTGRSTAQAWINFSSVSGVSGLEADTVEVHASYNISRIERQRDNQGDLSQGRYKVFFKPGLFDNANHYIAVGHSTGRATPTGGSDFDRVKVGIAYRHKDYVTFYVQQEDGDYTDAYYNDLVIFGIPSGVDGTTGESVAVGWETP